MQMYSDSNHDTKADTSLIENKANGNSTAAYNDRHIANGSEEQVSIYELTI